MSKDSILKISTFGFVFGPLLFIYFFFKHDSIIPSEEVEFRCGFPLYLFGFILLVGGILLTKPTMELHNESKGMNVKQLSPEQKDRFIFLSVVSSFNFCLIFSLIFGILIRL